MDEKRRSLDDLYAVLHQMVSVVLGSETVDAVMQLLASLAAAHIPARRASVSVISTAGRPGPRSRLCVWLSTFGSLPAVRRP